MKLKQILAHRGRAFLRVAYDFALLVVVDLAKLEVGFIGVLYLKYSVIPGHKMPFLCDCVAHCAKSFHRTSLIASSLINFFTHSASTLSEP